MPIRRFLNAASFRLVVVFGEVIDKLLDTNYRHHRNGYSSGPDEGVFWYHLCLLGDDNARRGKIDLHSLRAATGSDLAALLISQQKYRILRRAHYDAAGSVTVGHALESAIESEMKSIEIDTSGELPERQQAVVLLHSVTAKVGNQLCKEYATRWEKLVFANMRSN